MTLDTENFRLDEFMRIKKVSRTALAEQLGSSQPTISAILSGKRSLSRGMIARIGDLYPDLNTKWLLTGEGDMLKESAPELTKEDEQQEVPHVPVAALANPLAEYFGNIVRLQDCDTILSPVPGAELAITISGDSMEPKFHDNTIVFLKRINDAAFIPWGNTLVLDTENGIYIKDVYPIADEPAFIEARSSNPLYPPMRIPKTSIFGIYRVLSATKFYTTM